MSRPRNERPHAIALGVDVGLSHEATGLCVVESKTSETESGVCHFYIRHLERMPPGTSYREIHDRMEEIIQNFWERYWGGTTTLYVDVTGQGPPALDEIRKGLEWDTTPVYFNHGDQCRVEECPTYREQIIMGKAFLVARLRVLFQNRRLHSPKDEHFQRLANDLLSYRLQLHERANDHLGDFKVGEHDELVTALGLAVHKDFFQGLSAEEAERELAAWEEQDLLGTWSHRGRRKRGVCLI